jgi:transcriptional regulator with XRE-family HTH domain
VRAGTLLREARDRAGITQAALAARVGTTQSAIARIENGSEPTLARLTDLLAACGVAIQIHLARFDEGATDAAEPAPPEPWTPTEPVRRLAAHGVPFVLAGRAAASLHGATVAVEVPLVVPDLSGDGLERLASALDDLGARRRVPGDPSATLPFDRSAAGLRARRRWELATTVGPIDVDLEPPGTRGYLDLARGAVGIGDLVVASARDTARQLDAAGDDLGVITHLRSR